MLPEAGGDRPMRPVAAARRNKVDLHAREMLSGYRQETPVSQFVPDHEAGQMSPGHAAQDDLLLHQMITHRALRRTLDDIIIRLRPSAG